MRHYTIPFAPFAVSSSSRFLTICPFVEYRNGINSGCRQAEGCGWGYCPLNAGVSGAAPPAPLRGPCGGAVCVGQRLADFPGGTAAEGVTNSEYLSGAQESRSRQRLRNFPRRFAAVCAILIFPLCAYTPYRQRSVIVTSSRNRSFSLHIYDLTPPSSQASELSPPLSMAL